MDKDMSTCFDFYGLTPNKKQQYDYLCEKEIDETELENWLEENTEIHGVWLDISACSAGELDDWLYEYAEKNVTMDYCCIFTMSKNEAVKEAFYNLDFLNNNKILDDVWDKNLSLIVVREGGNSLKWFV